MKTNIVILTGIKCLVKLQTWPKMLGLDHRPKIDHLCLYLLAYNHALTAGSSNTLENAVLSHVTTKNPNSKAWFHGSNPGSHLGADVHATVLETSKTHHDNKWKNKGKTLRDQSKSTLMSSVAEIPPISMETKPDQHQILCKTLSPSISLGLKMSFFFHH